MNKKTASLCISKTKLLLFSFVVSLVFITICSKNSFLYPIQDWVDSNCFMTVGKSLNADKILYKDIIEQKGPVLYLLYYISALLSENSFLGAYIIEILSFSLFVFFSGKILFLLGAEKKSVYICLPLLSFAITVSPAFSHGGSAEELCLFALSYIICLLIKIVRYNMFSVYDFIIAGIVFSYVFWIKYTIAITFVGFIAFLFYFIFKEGRLKKNIIYILIFFISFVLSSAVIIAYFCKNNALYDLYKCYFYNNIFNYSNNSNLFLKIFGFVKNTFFTLGRNFIYGIFVVIGFVCIKKHLKSLFKPLLFIFVFTLSGTYTGGKFYVYYGLVLSVYAVFGIYYSICFLKSFFVKKNILLNSGSFFKKELLLAFLPLFSYFFSGNTYLMKYEKEDLPQYVFAQQINEDENPTLLNYGFLDGGFYFASQVLPVTKYFCHLNLKSDEMNVAMDEYINNGITDYVVTRNIHLEDEFDNLKYILIDKKSFVYERKKFDYYLYKKI